MPDASGSTTPSANDVATMASTMLPPFSSISAPAADASGCPEAITPARGFDRRLHERLFRDQRVDDVLGIRLCLRRHRLRPILVAQPIPGGRGLALAVVQRLHRLPDAIELAGPAAGGRRRGRHRPRAIVDRPRRRHAPQHLLAGSGRQDGLVIVVASGIAVVAGLRGGRERGDGERLSVGRPRDRSGPTRDERRDGHGRARAAAAARAGPPPGPAPRAPAGAESAAGVRGSSVTQIAAPSPARLAVYDTRALSGAHAGKRSAPPPRVRRVNRPALSSSKVPAAA